MPDTEINDSEYHDAKMLLRGKRVGDRITLIIECLGTVNLIYHNPGWSDPVYTSIRRARKER